MINKILLIIIFAVLITTADAQAQKKKPFQRKFLEDISDLVGTNGKGFQIQIGTGFTSTRVDGTKSYQLNLPVIIPRYAFSDHFGLQGEVSLDINNTGTDVEENTTMTEVPDFIIGGIYEFDPDIGFKFLNQFSLNLDNTIPLKKYNYFYSEMDINASTVFSDRTELDYTFGYGYQDAGDDEGIYSAGLDYYLSQNILLGITNNGTWVWNDAGKSFTNFIELELLLLSDKGIQLDFLFIKGLNTNYNYGGITFIKNL